QLGERAAGESRNVDLGEPDLASDARLAHALEVGEAKEKTLAGGEHAEGALQRDPILAQLVALLDRALAVEFAVLAVDELRDARLERRVALPETAGHDDP